MKKLKTILLCCMSLLLVSCLREDMSDCPPQVNLQLTFSYMGDTGDALMFARCIDHVTLMVYDVNNEQILNRSFNKNDLTQRQGAELYLDPGSYRIICWGNTFEHTELAGCESLSGGRLHHPNFPASTRIPTNSHLYYGSYSVVVPNQGMTKGNIPFRGAHINMEVYVRDLTSVNTLAVEPQIKVLNLMPQYNMEMTATMPYSTTYYPESTYNTDKMLNQALFQVLNFRDDNPVIIEIETEEAKSRIDLKTYMADNNISVNGKNEATVPLLIEFTDLGLNIKIPEWIINEVEPGVR